MKTLDLQKFDRGYDVHSPLDLLSPNDLTKAENVVWGSDGLVSRKGHVAYSTSQLATNQTIIGFSERYYINGHWVQLIARRDSSISTKILRRLDATSIVLDSTYDEFGSDEPVFFARMGDYIIATNGVSHPMIIYRDDTTGWEAVRYDSLDVREWDITTWNAGSYDGSYNDFTEEAQDDTGDDFPYAGDCGFWIASANPFTKIVMHDARQLSNVTTTTYEYWRPEKDGWIYAWETITPTTSGDWMAEDGDRTIEWDYLPEMGGYDGDDAVIPQGYYVIRVIIGQTGSPATTYCQKLEISHTHYLDEALGGGIPQLCFAHNSRIFLSVDSLAYMSPPNSMFGFRGESESEYFLEGGPKIRALVSYKNQLFVFKDNATYVFYGTTVEDFYRRKVSDRGIVASGAYAVTEVGVFYVSSDGIRVTTGDTDVRVSQHIEPQVLDFDTAGVVGAYFDGIAYLSFPNESTGVVLRFDPGTLEASRETGEARVSFYKYTGYIAVFFVTETGKDDLGFLLCASNSGGGHLKRLEGETYDTGRTGGPLAIAVSIETPYLFLASVNRKKRYGRMITTFFGGAADDVVTIGVRADRGSRTDSTTLTIGTSSDSVKEARLPYTMDGRNFSASISVSSESKIGLRGISVEYEYKEL